MLELTLRKYLEAEARTSKTNGAEQPGPKLPRERLQRKPSEKHPGPAPVKSAVMLDFINKAGAAGVTADEIYRFAEEGPIGIKVNSSRAMLWELKRRGRVVKREDRYYGLDSAGPGPQNPGLPLEH